MIPEIMQFANLTNLQQFLDILQLVLVCFPTYVLLMIIYVVNVFNSVFYILSECTEVSDCPNAGKDFQCNFNFCECESGFYFDDFSCADGK